jgi:MoxR-like ATPase
MHHVTPSGEPGIGKSRIAQTVAERIRPVNHDLGESDGRVAARCI